VVAVAVDPRHRVFERERAGDEIASAIAVEPLPLVEDESRRADEREVARGELIESGHTGFGLCLEPALVEFAELLRAGRWHVFSFVDQMG
jgi:hypothetical protein